MVYNSKNYILHFTFNYFFSINYINYPLFKYNISCNKKISHILTIYYRQLFNLKKNNN